jgi:hypothetical protein
MGFHRFGKNKRKKGNTTSFLPNQKYNGTNLKKSILRLHIQIRKVIINTIIYNIIIYNILTSFPFFVLSRPFFGNQGS